MGSSNSVPKRAPIRGSETLPDYESASGPFFNVEPDARATIVAAPSGIGSLETTPALTFNEVFKRAVKNHGSKVVMRTEGMPPIKKDQAVPGPLPLSKWKSWTLSTYYKEARQTAKAFMNLGHEPHDAVNIFGFNSPEWFLSQCGVMLAGGKAAGIYPSDNPDQVQFKSFHSNASVAVVENLGNFAKFEEIIDRVPYLKAIVIWADEPTVDVLTREDGTTVAVMSWEKMMSLAGDVAEEDLDKRIANQEPGDCCSLIYTSGTTGNPKAVMISHDNLIFESAAVINEITNIGRKAEEERILSYLPLSHVAGLMVDIMCPIVLPAFHKGWFCTHFARSYDLKLSTIGDRLKTVRPTVFLGVPRVWEKIAEKLKAIGATTRGVKKKLSTAAKKRGGAYQTERQLGGSGKVPSGYKFFNKLVLSKIKMALGLDACKFAFTGAAPISLDTLQYFGQLGININEVYGMSECTGATSWSTDKHHVWGSVGYALEGMEVKVFKVNPNDVNDKTEVPAAKNIHAPTEEEQGEICFRGRHIMMGYMANEKLGADHVAEIERKNAEAVDEDGWLHSGDKGCMGENGMFKITGRYKELIITAGGENVAPVPIEDSIKARLPAVSNVMMIGDKRKFNVALITLKAKGATGELPGTDELDGAARDVSDATTIPEASDDDKWTEYITKGITDTNLDGSVCPSNASRIQKFTILPIDFSVETGELTATLKLKRSVVTKKYAHIIEEMYSSSETYVQYHD